MGVVLDELVALLRLERIEVDLFRGQSQDLGWGRVFGGQVLGQALSAAEQTVPKERPCHSMHGYFLRPGLTDQPIVYTVDRIRDGGSFTTRRVVAIQDGKAIFSLGASFQKVEEGFEHQDAMPEAPPPESLESERDLARRLADTIPEALRGRVLAERPIEVRPVQVHNPLAPRPAPPNRMLWCRASGTLPDEPSLHQYLLAYASDFNLLGTAMLPHGVSGFTPGMQIASIDHAMWFHRPFKMDDWLLYVFDSASASGGRGLVRGRFFTRDGRLVASAAQEGLMRRRTPPA
jgi:acyl-CoA thioesterase II